MKLRILLMILLVASGESLVAQKVSETRDQTWLGYFNQTRFTDKSGMWIDLHHRLSDDFVGESATNIIRIGYTYYLSDQTRLTAGYGYVTHFSPGTLPDVPEHRPWQQIQWMDKKNGFSLAQYLRVEERYRRRVSEGELTNEYNFNWRFRYNFSLTLPLKGKQVSAKTPFLFFNNEIHINAGKEIVNNYFDQNRLFLGLGYQFTSQLNAQLGYLYVFQQLAAANSYVHINAIRLFVFHTLDLRKKE